MPITSTSNPRIKNVVRLTTSRRHRDRQRLTVVEGSREVRRGLDAGLVPTEAYICPPLVAPEDREIAVRLQTDHALRITHCFEVSPDVFAKIAYRGKSGGIVLVIPYTTTALDDLPLTGPPVTTQAPPPSLPQSGGEAITVPLTWGGLGWGEQLHPPFLVVVEGAEKPGNVGAILRTGDAAGVDGLILCAGGTDLHNPNVIRASLGTRFTVPCAEAPTAEVIVWLRRRGIRIVAASPNAELRYTEADMTGPVAVVTGSEAHGLSHAWRNAADVQVSIPMFGVADSLNLAASTALLLYEVVRQRGR